MTKNRFLLAFTAVVLVLALVRWTFLSPNDIPADNDKCEQSLSMDDNVQGRRYNRILSVPNYKVAFPDSQSVQIVAANRWGVKPVRNRMDAEERKKELVYIGVSPYYHVDRLSSSIPYLVPRAAMMLEDIGRAFYDSLYNKGLPMQQIIVTSVLRTMDDVARLQQRNGNATDNSCHLYGTTVDICYNRYQPIERPVRNDTLKWVLSEVLRDKRQEGRCYIKYEVKQGCFHMTVR
jgi:hypothetical protein